MCLITGHIEKEKIMYSHCLINVIWCYVTGEQQPTIRRLNNMQTIQYTDSTVYRQCRIGDDV